MLGRTRKSLSELSALSLLVHAQAACRLPEAVCNDHLNATQCSRKLRRGLAGICAGAKSTAKISVLLLQCPSAADGCLFEGAALSWIDSVLVSRALKRKLRFWTFWLLYHHPRQALPSSATGSCS
jgi:hypothetical protein